MDSVNISFHVFSNNSIHTLSNTYPHMLLKCKLIPYISSGLSIYKGAQNLLISFSSNIHSRLLKMNLLFILASLSAVAVTVLGGAIVSEDFMNMNVMVNVILYRTIPTHHVVTVYIMTSGEIMVNQDHR